MKLEMRCTEWIILWNHVYALKWLGTANNSFTLNDLSAPWICYHKFSTINQQFHVLKFHIRVVWYIAILCLEKWYSKDYGHFILGWHSQPCHEGWNCRDLLLTVYIIKTHGCKSWGKKVACIGLHNHYNELFTSMTAVKFANIVNKPPWQLGLSETTIVTTMYVKYQLVVKVYAPCPR